MSLNEVFEYKLGCLYWLKCPPCRVKPGDLAGSVTKDGYLAVRFQRKLLMVHRVIWELVHGVIPEGMEVDHIDHNRTNNFITNLRLVSASDNQKNRSRRADNSSGVTGVHWNSRKKKWVAAIRANSTVITLGYFSDKDDAISARKQAEIDYGFHQNHGK